MGWVSVVSSIISGVQAISSFSSQQKAAKETKRANAAMMAAAEEEARINSEDAKIKAKNELAQAAATRSQQLALYLKSGVTLDGSPMLVLDDTKARGQENADNVIKNADSQNRSMLLRAQANQQPVERADLFGTASAVLGSASKAAKAGSNAGYW